MWKNSCGRSGIYLVLSPCPASESGLHNSPSKDTSVGHRLWGMLQCGGVDRSTPYLGGNDPPKSQKLPTKMVVTIHFGHCQWTLSKDSTIPHEQRPGKLVGKLPRWNNFVRQFFGPFPGVKYPPSHWDSFPRRASGMMRDEMPPRMKKRSSHLKLTRVVSVAARQML